MSEETIKEFEQFVVVLVDMSMGFRPLVKAIESETGRMSLVLDGSPLERSIMMGTEARTFQAIKHLLRLFARRQGYFVELFVKPSDGYFNKTITF